ncbi:primary-amine oxidase [Agrobacterium vitis]|uniref:Amine oxidase n=1 Tax=Agrobacterium vitis TaxID=373 RepID=A0AAE4WFB2_AGRVI|nr:primary-amine oxidase [Agrobacterium vitis]MCF1500062.1 primary-amine oxidase [Allorhizobium sp. Av2]MCM2442253.1 primary-amine oxidase [Agrobacterium vitis]MUZ58663.1 primary-amine oxidase [Agrobacterium vitis]MVA66298.1 primary-amine oxidase [Agrobacterium vitis]MVA88335.1 primary-amine oxidase [Agrobacterium vitis]
MDTCCVSAAPRQIPLSVTHPLQPLTPDEIRAVATIVRKDPPYGADTRFETIELMEPDKATVRAFSSGAPIARKARVNVFSAAAVTVTSLVVCLDTQTILTRKDFPGKRPMIQLEQFLSIEGIVRTDPEFIAACAKRGITDMETVCVDPWSAGNFGVPGEEGRHLCHIFCWLRLRENENFYAHPIEGLNAVVDLITGKVIRVDDYGVVPVPMQEVNYESQFIETFQPTAKPIDVVQQEGVNFAFDGHRITWRNWSLVVGFNAREALTLHDIRFDGRPIVNRASIVEMTVPYGSPDNGHFRKNVFDIGEYGIGKLANSLKLGCDCLGVIKYLDVHLNTMDGDPWTIEKAICIHEEDSGLLWKHMDFRTERSEIRRGAKLVVSTICTVGNYEYGLYWYLFLDGTIEHEVKATGIINTAACIPGQPPKYGREVAPGVVGHIHQHILCARLDMAVDGDANSVVECNTYAEPLGPANPYGNAFFEQQTVLGRESEATRRADPASHRYWKVINPNKTNYTGAPVGYKLEANHCVTPFVHPDSPSGKRAAFVQNHVWVTAFDPEERFPAGDFVNHSDGAGGLIEFVAKNRPIENTDIVLWHVFGLHHPVRVEDFPVQPCVFTGFKLMPSGFFDRNPAINLPPVVNTASCPA